MPDLSQSIYDRSLLSSRTTDMAILLCTDDTLVVLSFSTFHQEAVISKRCQCRDRTVLPSDFKGIDVTSENFTVVLSRQKHIDKQIVMENVGAKADLNRSMTDEDLTKHRKTVERLAWLAQSHTRYPVSSQLPLSRVLQGRFTSIILQYWLSCVQMTHHRLIFALLPFTLIL